jgi:16S rRNA (guanine966-N2)-methyltransferase
MRAQPPPRAERGAVRIVGGTHRGTGLVAPKGSATRPTSDRLRETIFNILVHRWEGLFDGARVLDLFAGSGAMGLEAMSRGAGFTLFVETATEARGAIRRNVDAVGLAGRTRVWRRDATKLGPAPVPPFGVVFADPPYEQGLGEAALAEAAREGWATADAVAVLEERAGALPAAVAGWERVDARAVGDSAFAIFTRAGA